MNDESKMSPAARRKARYFALQALYQWQLSGNDLADIEVQYLTDNDMKRVDTPYFRELLHGVPQHLDTLDEKMADILDRPLKELDPIELAVLRIGIYELTYRPDVPYRVVINEALELAKLFGAEDGYKYVNGILDKVAQQLRKNEIKTYKNSGKS